MANLMDALERLLSAVLSREEAEVSGRAASLRARQYHLREEAVKCAYLVALGAVIRGGVARLAIKGRVRREGGEVCFCVPDPSVEDMIKEGSEVDPSDYERLRRVTAALSRGFREPGGALTVFRRARRLLTILVAAALTTLVVLVAMRLGGVESFWLLSFRLTPAHMVMVLALCLLAALSTVLVAPLYAKTRLDAIERDVEEAFREVEVVCRPYEELFTGSGRPRRPP